MTRCRIAPLLSYGSDDCSAPMDALMKIVEWMLLIHILLSEIHWADNHIKSAPHELQSLPMRHLYLSLPAAHPVFITQRNWWQLVHFSFGSVADSMFFIALFNSSFIFYQYTVWAFVVGGSKGWRVPPPSSPFELTPKRMHRNFKVSHLSFMLKFSCHNYFSTFTPNGMLSAKT